MDQIKIGHFIAECRKKNSLTQIQLAEKLGITDRAVSKWETGRSLPDASIMLDLCKELKITVNDLLSGEIVTMNDYNEKLEQNLIEAIKQKEESDKRLLRLDIFIGLTVTITLFSFIAIAAYIPMADWQRFLLIGLGFIIFLTGCFFALQIEQMAGYYECRECGHRYIPTYKAVTFAMHMGRTRYLKCPECNQKSWQKKVLHKKETHR